ncbi:DUF4145 domain-containing protein [Agrobacterium sp. 22-211-1]
MFSVPSTCGRCNELVDFHFKALFDHTQRTPEEVKKLRDLDRQSPMRRQLHVQVLSDGDLLSASALCHCPRCNGPALIVFKAERATYESIKNLITKGDGAILGGFKSITVEEVHPAPARPDADPHWPEEITRQFVDAQNMLNQGITPSIITGVCRTVLDVVTKKLGAKESDTLFKRIEFLRDSSVITQPISDWAHALRLDGNAATHDAVGDANEAREYIEFLRMFLNMAFALPARIEAKRQHS